MISGHHHISMFTKDLKENNHFYTEVLGLRRVKVSVNQGDPKMYHVFYGDALGSAGNDLTFFEIGNIGSTHPGTNMISAIGLLVPSHESLQYWQQRLDSHGVSHEDITRYADREALRFNDPDGLALVLINHDNQAVPEDWQPWSENDIEEGHRILGMGTVEITVMDMPSIVLLLENTFGYTVVHGNAEETLLTSVADEVFGEILIKAQSGQEARAGRGSVHHLAIQSKERPLLEWDRILKDQGYATTGIKDRYYFESLYFTEENDITFEIVGPVSRGFTADRSAETLGTTLDLPPFLEERREEIESYLRPIEEWT
ncbi:ring-cleaving dioxygenase [Salinicoccus cyprini]|uniref:Ring-cleaving dioxygenase n=1 Tax=Salinicoccus cyprini TaxID=2493691 RepID=A0A558ATY2_9STAP|nr:VOC family protein [Salinicoccus cyprini]TVT27646.1 ring-cleaving dioxygenase [Salinicoccus cyprini]